MSATLTMTSDAVEARYTLPVIEDIADSPAETRRKQERIRELCRERNAVLLAHHYQRPEVQEVADFVADSLRLSQMAAQTEAATIVMCGVHFMAETAAILCPDKTVLLPDLRAGCSLAAAVTPEELRAWKARFPEAVVVSYINTSAAVKAESDYCCTSANASKVVNAIPADKPVLFLPDKFLAAVVARQTGRSNIIAYPGYCHVHKGIKPEDVVALLDQHPDIELLLHPECGCVSSCMAKVMDGSLPHGSHLLPLHRGHAAAHLRIARRRICSWHRARHHAPPAQGISREILLSRESQCRLCVYEDHHARSSDRIARKYVAACRSPRGNRRQGAQGHRSYAGAGMSREPKGPASLRVGIVGAGAIGQIMGRAIDAGEIPARLVAVADLDQDRAAKFVACLANPVPVIELDELVRRADLIVEAAGQAALPQVVPAALAARKDLLVMSVGGLLGRDDWFQLAGERGCRIHIPSGAIAGLDGLRAARRGGNSNS